MRFGGRFLQIEICSSLRTDLSGLDAEEARHADSRGRGRLRSANAILLAHDLNDDHVRHLANGRPHFATTDMDLSLSHKNQSAAAAVSPAGTRVGVDIEAADAIDDPKLFAKFSLHEKEHAGLAAFASAWGASRQEALVALWSLKESLFKATGQVVSPNKICFALDGEQLAASVRVDDKDLDLLESLVQIRNGQILTALVVRES